MIRTLSKGKGKVSDHVFYQRILYKRLTRPDKSQTLKYFPENQVLFTVFEFRLLISKIHLQHVRSLSIRRGTSKMVIDRPVQDNCGQFLGRDRVFCLTLLSQTTLGCKIFRTHKLSPLLKEFTPHPLSGFS